MPHREALSHIAGRPGRRSASLSPGRERFLGMVCGIPRRYWDRRLLMSLRAFFDDSGATDPQAPFVVLAGAVGTLTNWERLSDHWEDLIRSWGLTWFHMTDAEAHPASGPYATWTPEERHERVLALCELIAESVDSFVYIAMPRGPYAEFERLLGIEDALLRKYGATVPAQTNPYLPLFRGLVEGMAQYCEDVGELPRTTEVFLATQKGAGPRAKHHFLEVWKRAGFQEPVFREPRGRPPLQAADVIAWCVQRSLKRGPSGLYARHEPLKVFPRRCYMVKEKDIRDATQAYAEDLRKAGLLREPE